MNNNLLHNNYSRSNSCIKKEIKKKEILLLKNFSEEEILFHKKGTHWSTFKIKLKLFLYMEKKIKIKTGNN